MGTAVVGGIVIGITILAVKSIIKNKKAGKSLQCGGDCSHCAGNCNRKKQTGEADDENRI